MGVKLNGSTGFLEYAGRLVSSFPATILMWVGVDAATDSFVISQTKADGDGDISMFFLNNGSAKLARHRIVDNTASAQANVVNTTAFKLAMAVFTSASSRTMYFSTVGSVATDTGALSDTCSTHNDFLIGAQKGGGNAAALFFNGAVAEAHVYNVALTATDFTNLAADSVKPEAVTGWVDGWQLKTAADLTSIGGTRTLTLNGGVTTETVRTHPIARSTPVPVSFSGPVPTRNGVLGTATTFANAGFFAGNLTPFAYSSVGTSLPAGVTLNTSTGVLSLAASGATAGTTSGIIIRATDTGSNIANTNAYSIVIAASNAAPTFPGNISNISGTAGSAITPVNVSGQFSDTDTLTYTASPAGTAWPSGLIVNSSTGIISGTVAGAGTTSGLKVRATDTASQTVDSNAFNAVIAASSTTRTWTPTIKLEALADETPFPNHAIHAIINDMAGNLIDTKTGLTTNSVGLPPPFTTSTGALTTDYRVSYVDDVDLTIFAVENLRCV